MSERWRVVVDADTCFGSGICAATASHQFAIGRDRRSHALSEVVDADADILDAAEGCPVEAISVSELVTGRLIHPAD